MFTYFAMYQKNPILHLKVNVKANREQDKKVITASDPAKLVHQHQFWVFSVTSTKRNPVSLIMKPREYISKKELFESLKAIAILNSTDN